jgi:hypothetical protein
MGDTDFRETIDRLKAAKYVEYKDEDYEDEYQTASLALGSQRQIIKKRYEGYVITTDGALAFRRQIKVPIQKIMAQVDTLAVTSSATAEPAKLAQFKQIVETPERVRRPRKKLC